MPRIRSEYDKANTTDPRAGLQGQGALAAIRDEKTLAELAQQFDGHPNQITSWKGHLLKAASGLFGPGGGTSDPAPSIDVKTLHAKIGELTLENDFLSGALSKSGLRSAKR